MGKSRLKALALGLLLSAPACSGPAAASQLPGVLASGPVPAVSPVAGWFAARVEQPASIEAAPTDAPGFCSPCHPVVGTYIDALAAVPGGYVALGFDLPPSHAAAWLSTDTRTWRRVAGLPAPEGSAILAAAPGPVAVGTDGRNAAAWQTSDGLNWTMETLAPPAESGATERLTAAVVAAHTYLAGGYTTAADGATAPTFWRLEAGSWQRSTVAALTVGSRVTGMAEATGTAAAVGFVGDTRRGTMQAWRSTDSGGTWQPVSSPAFSTGRPLAVASDGSGFCAVGETVDQTGAAAWTSTDGSSWHEVPAQPALDNDGAQMPITAVAAARNGGYVAAGWKDDAANGSAVVWTSPDCRSWTRLPRDISFFGAGMSAVLATDLVVGAGSMGWPDTHAAQVWVRGG